MVTRMLAVVAVALAAAPSALAAAGGCHSFSGTFQNYPVPCTIPALVCVGADTTGDLAGTGVTSITGFDPVTRTFTGPAVITLANGAEIYTTLVGRQGGPFSVETFTGGTRQFAHATGTMIVLGSGGSALTDHGIYSGQYCLGIGAREHDD